MEVATFDATLQLLEKLDPYVPLSRDQNRKRSKVESDFQKRCSKGAKFAAYTAFWAIIRDVSCLFSLALEFSTRFGVGLESCVWHCAALARRTVVRMNSRTVVIELFRLYR